jgi:outer membrane protein assembly factor BamE (lipoprotein component of BamABCDE complex)
MSCDFRPLRPAQPVSRKIGLACCVLLVALPGCSVIKATRQPGKKNLAVLSPGVPRMHVIAELGAPIFTEERANGTVDVFTFKQGYTKVNKAGRALVHGAADVATWGLWEVIGTPAETLADGTDVKVEVAYDENRFVRSVTFFEGDKVMRPGPLARFARRGDPPTAAPVPAVQ